MNGKGTNVQYGYDDYGNLVSDPYKEITDISYNHLNLPVKITFGGGGKIEYFYDATGLKLKKKVTDGTTITTTDYMDGFQYTNGKLDFFPHAEGYAKAIPSGLGGSTSYTFKYVFSYTDHLGNIRVKYAQNPANGNQIEILEEDHYYPYGLKHIGYNGNHTTWDVTPGGEITLTPVNPFLGDTYKYKFGGKEYDDTFDINTYDFGARNYDPALGRWMNIDPLAENSRRWTPYNFVYNNPLRFVDPDGMQGEDIITIMDNGTIERVETDDNFDIVQNESGDKSITIDHDENGSQIGEVQTATGTDNNGNTVSTDYVMIENKEVATEVFEFGAEISKDARDAGGAGFEFSMDSFSFGDGFETNSISIGNGPTGGALGGSVLPLGAYSGIDLGGNHFTQNATWTENNHFHPSGGFTPSGFNGWLVNGTPTFEIAKNKKPGDRGAASSGAQNSYLYSLNLSGYVKYNNKSASFVGNKN